MHQTVVTRKGQITLPAEVRRELGLRQGDRVTVELVNGQATVRKAEGIIARTAGAARTHTPPPSAEELREDAESAWAQESGERND